MHWFPSRLIPRAAAITVISLFTGSTHAQVGTSRDVPSEDEEPIQLSPFTVVSDGDVGYVAANSLAGSRMNTSLKDTAASISVFTEEFLSDIGATDMTSALAYANNVEFELNDAANNPAPNNNVLVTNFQGYRVRGLPATLARNYFEWGIPTDNYNIDRIEDSRGPNSVLFGIAQAGGLLNASTKRAISGRSFRRASLAYGSYDSHRATVDVNQVAGDGKLAVRVNALYKKENSFRRFIFKQDKRIHLAATYKFSPSTSIRAEYEGGILRENVARPFNLTDASLNWLDAGRPTTKSPVPTNAAQGLLRFNNNARVTYIANSDLLMNMAGRMSTRGSSTIILDPALTDRSINVSGPGALRSSDFDTYSAFLEHRFGPRTFLEVAFNHQEFKMDARDPTVSSSNLVGDPNQFLPNGAPNPYAGQLLLEAAWFRTKQSEKSDTARVMFSTGHDAGKWGDYRLVLMAEHQDARSTNSQMGEFWDGHPFNANPENGANQVWRRNYVTEGDWGTYYINSDVSLGPITNRVDPISGRTLSSVWIPRSQGSGDQPTTTKTGLLGLQARYLKGRLIANLGYRYDNLRSIDRGPNIRDPLTNILMIDYANGLDVDFTGRTKTLGLVGHLTPHISLLGNYATNLGLPNPRSVIIGGAGGPAREGQGKDIGIAVTLLGGRVYAKAVYYETNGKNLVGSREIPTLTATADRVLETLVSNNLITAAQAATHTTGAATVGVYDLDSSGYEFQLMGNLTRNWRLLANFSITDASEQNISPEVKAYVADNFPFFESFNQNLVTSNGQTIAQELAFVRSELDTVFETEGQRVFGNRRYKGSLFTRYGFDSGRLKGFFVGAGFKRQSKIVIGRDLAAGTTQYGNAYSRVDGLLGYNVHGLRHGRKLSLQLNVFNVLNDTDPLILRLQGDNIRRYKLSEGREWRLTANLEF